MAYFDFKKSFSDRAIDLIEESMAKSPRKDVTFDLLVEGIRHLGAQLESQRLTQDKIEVSSKADGSVVTNADKELSNSIKSLVSVLYPNDYCCSEEDFSGEEICKSISHERTWVIDPVDHTRRYVESDPYYLISLTAIKDFLATEAILAQPAFDSVVTVERDKGARVNGHPIHVSDTRDLSDAKISAVFCDFPNAINETYARFKGFDETPEALIGVANGSLDGAVIKMCGHQIWDIAYASLLVSEAGGWVTNEKGAPLRFRDINPSIEYIIASNGRIHNQLLSCFADNFYKAA